MQILSASLRLTVQEVDDPRLCVAWGVRRVAPMVTDHPAGSTLH